MTVHRQSSKDIGVPSVPCRVGLFGLFGQGNIGNDGSLQAMLAYLRAEHSDVILDVFCTGPDDVTARYGVPATAMHWYQLRPKRQRVSKATTLTAKCIGMGLGIGIDTYRAAAWIRCHDVVIVPGMGVLEATIVLRPWYTPYSMFLLSVIGRLSGTKIALVSVGSNVIRQRATRRFFVLAARLAHYRSFRDDLSRDALQKMGLDTSDDSVYPDLTFSLPTPEDNHSITGTIGLGVMNYSGGNGDRLQAEELRSSYIEKMTRFALWLVSNGRSVRLFTGDTADEPVMQQIIAGVRTEYPELEPGRLIAEPTSSLDELMRQMALVDIVVATRFHNVVCALKMAKPTIALGYSAKHGALMADYPGMAGFCQPVKTLTVDRLIELFTELESRSLELQVAMTQRNAAKAELVRQQLAEMSAVLLPPPGNARCGKAPHATAYIGPSRSDTAMQLRQPWNK